MEGAAASRPARLEAGAASIMSQGGFEMVTRGSRRCAKGKGRGPRYVPSASADQEDDLSTDAIVAKVSSSIEALRQTSWFSQVTGVVLSHLSVLETASDSSVASPHPGVGAAQEMVCYGIGHFSRSRASQLQAALAVLLKESCGVGGCAWLFDPILTPNERAAAQALGFTMLDENEVGLRRVEVTTLFYMPHCGRRLYSNVLRANWSPLLLSKAPIFGNSFEEYGVRILDAKAKASCCVARLASRKHVTQQGGGGVCDSNGSKVKKMAPMAYICHETRLPPFEEEGPFQDMSMHSFPCGGGGSGNVGAVGLALEPSGFWDLPPDAGGDDHGWA